ncbi:hypothetical protein ACFYWH_34160 [Streptomyces sp. NPDC003737]|uniref:hypothetical protein n=1 Tax=Streptomyces sp. NPDC003737 TaxID=3364685 RepID=UPI0036A9B38C
MSEEQAARTVGDIVTASAAGRTVDVLAALLLALGEGSHQLSIVAERANGTTASAGLSLSDEVAPLCGQCAEEYLCLLALLTFAVGYSAVRHAVLVVTTAGKPYARAPHRGERKSTVMPGGQVVDKIGTTGCVARAAVPCMDRPGPVRHWEE